MQIDLALLADAATVDTSGKLNILGIFDRISAAALPARHPRMCLVLRFHAGVQEAGRHDVQIRLNDPAGQELMRLDGEMQITPAGTGLTQGVRVPHVLNLDGLVFPVGGQYGFDVRVDGEHHVTIPLAVLGAGVGAEA